MKHGAAILGVWVGALVVSCPIVAVMLYLLTGKIPLPACCAGGGLRSPEEVAADLEEMARKHEEAH